MFAKLFQKPNESHKPNVVEKKQQGTTPLSDWSPRVPVHYGIPSTASVLAFDPIQRLLAIGTLDGRIKVIGGGNVEGLLVSPKALPFKSLEFLQNQGFLVSVSNDNEIQVWDLEKRCISAQVQWESNITAFSVVFGTYFMYVGDEYGFLSVMKYDTEEGEIFPLAYHVPPNLISEGIGITLPEQLSIVGVLAQPCSYGNRVLIAYENGLIVLWDVTKDKAVHVRGCKDLQPKEEIVFNFSNNESHSYKSDPLDDEEVEKEISSLCWASSDGSVLAVGYVDGDILLWNLSVSDNDINQGTHKSTHDVVKINLSSADRRLPVIVLHWFSRNVHGGQLFVYGGEDIGSDEVLTILDIDWSSGLAKLKCLERVDLTLHGSFADVTVISNYYEEEKLNKTSLFVLTNPGQLHFYEYASLSIFKSEGRQNHTINPVPYRSGIPTVEPYMTIGKLHSINAERDSLISLPETVFSPKSQSNNVLAGGGSVNNWPLTGEKSRHISANEHIRIERIYIGGYQDGSVRIWDATSPNLSLISVLGFEGIQVNGTSSSISALNFSSANQTLAAGNECGLIFLSRLQSNANQTTMTIVNETNQEVHNLPNEDNSQCYAIISILNSPVRALQFSTCGVKLVAGFESGQVSVLDVISLSVLFVSDSVCSSKSPIVSLSIQNYANSLQIASSSENETETESAEDVIIILTKDAHIVSMNSITGNLIGSRSVQPNDKSTARSMDRLESKHSLAEESKGDLILLCCEDALYFYSLDDGNSYAVRELKLDKPCSWSTVFKRNTKEYGFVIVYQTGEIEARSLPDLIVLGHTSMMSILRWNFKNNMSRTMSASEKGLITMVNGSEFAFASLMTSENEFSIPENLPCLHDKVLAANAVVDVRLSQIQKKAQSTVPGFVGNMIKGLKGDKAGQVKNDSESYGTVIAHLEGIFSRFPFSDPTDDFDLEDTEIHIDDIDIDELVPVPYSPEKSSDNIKGKEKERERLFEGGSSDDKPKTRTREEIIAKYRNTGDAASAASQAKDKLLERQEKLERISLRTEELQNGAENFASMAQELARTMEKRSKWWKL